MKHFPLFLLVLSISCLATAQNIFILNPQHSATNVRGLFAQAAVRDSMVTLSATASSLVDGLFFNFDVPVENVVGAWPVSVRVPSLGVTVSPFRSSNEFGFTSASVGFTVNEFKTLDFLGVAGISNDRFLLNIGFDHRSLSDNGVLRRDNQFFFLNSGVRFFDTKAEAEVIATNSDSPVWQVGVSQEAFPGLFFSFAVEAGSFSPVRRLSISYSLLIKS